MSTFSNDGPAEAADIAAALRSLKPNRQHHNAQLFATLHPVIVEMLDQKVTQKAILKTLAEHGLKLHPARFKELMAISPKSGGDGLHADAGTTPPSISEDA